jgi:hypothetical protein
MHAFIRIVRVTCKKLTRRVFMGQIIDADINFFHELALI